MPDLFWLPGMVDLFAFLLLLQLAFQGAVILWILLEMRGKNKPAETPPVMEPVVRAVIDQSSGIPPRR